MAQKQPGEGAFRKWIAISWKYSWGFRGSYLEAVVSQAGSGMAKAATFFLPGCLVEEEIGRSSVVDFLPMLAAYIIALALPDGGISFGAGVSSSEIIVRRLCKTLYDRIQRLPFACHHDRMADGEPVRRCASDVDAVRRFFAEQAVDAVRILMLFVVKFAGWVIFSPKPALASVVVVPALHFCESRIPADDTRK
jgi:ATP-binding cassette subfamily B protein